MSHKSYKIGFSNIGGIYVGKNIQSDVHKHYAISVLLSFGESFKITSVNQQADYYQAAIIQKNVEYSLKTSDKDHVAFIHIVPYSETGMNLSDKHEPIRKMDIESFQNIIADIKNWFETDMNEPEHIETILQEIGNIPRLNNEPMIIDERILKSFDLIMKHDVDKLSVHQVAPKVHLSVSHFNRLFKKETGMTFRQFLLYSKLIKSIYALYEQNNLTEAAFLGGFSDQPHFTRTFKSNFGIKPSSV